MAWSLQLEQSVLIGGLVWPAELLAIPALVLAVAVAVAVVSAFSPAWEACRVSVFALLQSRRYFVEESLELKFP